MSLVDWKYEKVGNLRVKFFESGDRTKTPLVLIPGWPISACVFERLTGEIGNHWHCVGLNLPGFGGSGFDQERNHTFDYYAGFLDDFRRLVLKCEKIDLFGYSSGGVVAIDFASLFPENTEKLVIFSAPYNGPSHWAQTEKHHHLSVLLGKLIVHDWWLIPLFNAPLFKRWWANNTIAQLYAAGKYPKLFSLPKSFLREVITQSTLMNSLAADELGDDLINHDFSDKARAIRAKTLVIGADHDEAVPPHWSEKLAKDLLPNGKFVLVKEADHAVVVTEPEKIAPHILTFING